MRELTISEMVAVSGGLYRQGDTPGCMDTMTGCDGANGDHFHDFVSMDGKSGGDKGHGGGIGGVISGIGEGISHFIGKLGDIDLKIVVHPAQDTDAMAVDGHGNPIRDRYGNVYRLHTHTDGSWELQLGGKPVFGVVPLL